MVVTRRQTDDGEELFGVAADDKPAASTGSKFFEEDTGDVYRYTGTTWIKFDFDNPVGGGGGGGGGDASAANQTALNDAVGTTADAAIDDGSAGTLVALMRGLNLLWSLVTDQVNGRIRAEINTLHYSEDSIKPVGEDLLFATATITTTTATSIVTAPAAGNHHVVKKSSMQLLEDVPTVASLRGLVGATDVAQYRLDYTGATAPSVVGLDFGNGGHPAATATAISGKLSVAPATGGVRFNVWYVTRPD